MKQKWSSEFGLYRYDNVQMKSSPAKTFCVVVFAVILISIVLYFTFYFVKSQMNYEMKNKTVIDAQIRRNYEVLPDLKQVQNPQKLIATEVITDQFPKPKQPPKPFETTFYGDVPSSFTSTEPSTSTRRYPQIAASSLSSLIPRNIQDIIRYMTNSKSNHEETTSTIKIKAQRVVKKLPKEESEEIEDNARLGETFHLDPFNLYKPKDPSDVNLMATGNLRFAPPAWTNFKKPKPNLQHYGSAKPILGSHSPLILTLNLYPLQNEEKEEDLGIYPRQNRRNQNRFRIVNSAVDRFRPKTGIKPKKMIIRLNLFAEDQDINLEDIFNGNVEVDFQQQAP